MSSIGKITHNSYPDSNRSMIVFYKQYTSDKYFKIQPA